MKSHLLALCAALSLASGSGCCCFWHNVHNALNCGHGGGCGGGCGNQASPNCSGGPTPTCGATGLAGGCGCGHGGDCSCGQSCGCGQGGGGGGQGRKFGLLSGLLGYNGCNNGCSIFGCSSHYLDPQGACYGAYCGNCCNKAGCGCMYWGDYWNVPPTTDPCDCCQNYVGPSHSPYGSTPCYYGPAPPNYAPHYATGGPMSLPTGQAVAAKPANQAAPATKIVNRPASTNAQQ